MNDYILHVQHERASEAAHQRKEREFFFQREREERREMPVADERRLTDAGCRSHDLDTARNAYSPPFGLR